MSKSIFKTGTGAHLKHKMDGREFGIMVRDGLKVAAQHQRQVKMELMDIMESIDTNNSNITKQDIKAKLLDLYKKMK